MQVGTDSILNFIPLVLTNSGQYVCTVTVTSDLLSFPLTDESDVFEVPFESELIKQWVNSLFLSSSLS